MNNYKLINDDYPKIDIEKQSSGWDFFDRETGAKIESE